MKKSILLGKCSNNLKEFLKKEFDCEFITFFNEETNKFIFNFTELENIINNNVENIFISDKEEFSKIFLNNNFYDSKSLSNIKNIFFIPETLNNLYNLINYLPYSFSDNSKVINEKNLKYIGGYVKKSKDTRDIFYKFKPSFNLILNNKSFLFKLEEIKEDEFYIDYTNNDEIYSIIKEVKLESFIGDNVNKNSKAILFSNLDLNLNKIFFKKVITKEINR